MDKKLKSKWVKALRSGRFKQGYYQLRNSKGEYCCLGVLCEVAHKRYRGDNKSVHPLPEKILPASVQDTLSSLNDDGNSFKKIARYIEKHL